MKNYRLYKEDSGLGVFIIAEVFNNIDDEILNAQKSLVEQGYVILETIENFIKCRISNNREATK